MRRAARRDATEASIVAALRQVGYKVLLQQDYDALVWLPFTGETWHLEFKSPGGRPTTHQIELVEQGFPLKFVQTVDEAFQAVGHRRAA